MFLKEGSRAKRQVYLDIDDRRDLPVLLDFVGKQTSALLILCTQGLLKNPSCVGEMVIAKINKVTTISVIFSDAVTPDLEFIHTYQERVPDLTCLVQNGIDLRMIQFAIDWMMKTPAVNMDT